MSIGIYLPPFVTIAIAAALVPTTSTVRFLHESLAVYLEYMIAFQSVNRFRGEFCHCFRCT